MDIKIVPAGQIFFERGKNKFGDVDFCEEIEFVNKAVLCVEYGKEKIEKEDYNWPNYEGGDANDQNMICVHHFYHRPTKHLPHGIYIKYTEKKILETITDEKELRKIMPTLGLPYVFSTDIELDNDIWGRSFFINLEQKNNIYDLIDQGVVRNIGVASHPKLMLPEGSVNLKQMNNEYSAVQYRGAMAPSWLQHNYVNRGEFEIQDRLERKMDSLAKVSELTKNPSTFKDMPASAIRLLEDQATGVNTSTVEKRKILIKEIYWMMAMGMGENYKDDDGRIVSILGEDNEYMIKSFKKVPAFSKLASVEPEFTSALSSTRAGKVADIVDLNAANQQDPAFGRKEIIALLGLGTNKAFREEISFGVVTSRTVLDMLKNGEIPQPPEETDDLITMYMMFVRYMESVAFKLKLSPDKKENISKYVMGIEALMTKQALQNATFASKLRIIDRFPIFFDNGQEITKPISNVQPQPSNQVSNEKPLANMQERTLKGGN